MEFPAFAQLCKQHGALVVVNAVCTLSTKPLQKDDWGIDVVLTGSQKGLSSLPGVSPINLFGCCLGTDRKASRAQAALVFGCPSRQ